MKTSIISLISLYQKIISPLLHQLVGQKKLCRYEISCSEFAKHAIKTQGVIAGSKSAVLRVISCQPFTNAYV